MIALAVVVAIFASMLCGLAVRADVRFRGERRLPMQWWLTGEVTWSAPRRVALAFIPVAAILMLVAYLVLASTLRPRAGQEHFVLPVMILLGATFVAAQLLHIRLIAWTLRRNGG